MGRIIDYVLDTALAAADTLVIDSTADGTRKTTLDVLADYILATHVNSSVGKTAATAIGELKSNMASVGLPLKNSGSITTEFAASAVQISADRAMLLVPLPFLCANVAYNVTVNSCVFLGIASIDVSTISVDARLMGAVRLAVQYSGTAGTAYSCQVGLTISYT